jgi:hypothetical protein
MNSKSYLWFCGLLLLTGVRLHRNAPLPVLPPLAFPEAGWRGPDIIRIPFTLTGTLVTIRARVDTVEGDFLFDTGCSRLLLNNRYFTARPTGTASAGGVTGGVQITGTTRIDTLRSENLLQTDLQADLVDLRHIERAKKNQIMGLIGYEVFADYEVLFDYEAALIVLIRTDARGNRLEELSNVEYYPVGRAELEVSGHVAMAWLKFGDSGKPRRFALDSGAEQNLLSSGIGGRFLKEHFEVLRRVKLRGAGNKTVEVLSGLLQHARIDTFSFRPMSTLLTNLYQINAVYQTQVEGVLGYEFLMQRPMSINYRRRQLTFYEKLRP